MVRTQRPPVAVAVVGLYFVKPARQKHRDARLKQRKSYSPALIQRLYFHGTLAEKLWIALAVNGAMDNGDIANLTFDMIAPPGGAAGEEWRVAGGDVGGKEAHSQLPTPNSPLPGDSWGTIDYRRRKTGLMPRLIPVHPDVWELLELWVSVRPKALKPEYERLVFLTPSGLPLARAARGKVSGKPHWIDAVATAWTDLRRRAGLGREVRGFRACRACGIERRGPGQACPGCGKKDWVRKEKLKEDDKHVPDRKGFRALRTTFGNLAPVGYRDEVELIMGHAGSVLLENYLEDYGVMRLRELVAAIWERAFGNGG